MKYLLDTNILSELVRPNPKRRIVEQVALHQSTSASSATVWHELSFGLTRLPASKKKSLVAAYLASLREWLTFHPYDDEAAAWHGAERARLEKLGVTPAFADGQIAAVAATRGLKLVTQNTKDFKRFRGLTVESWG